MRLIVVAASLAIAAFLCYQAARIWRADALVHSENPSTIARGAALEPGNGDAWDRLGHYYEWNFTNPNPALAISYYNRAFTDDPRSANFLMDLASAYEAAGDLGRAQQAWKQAQAAYPSSAEVDWNYGNFLLRQGSLPEAYAEIRKSVQADPKLLTIGISRAWRASHDVQQLLNQALPPDANAYFQALDFFSSIQQADAALQVWEKLMRLGQRFELSRSFPFLEDLIREGRAADARRVWLQALAAAGRAHDEPANHSAVWDGDFAQDFANGGLGWRWHAMPGASVDFNPAPGGHGARSVRLDFGGGTNLDLSQPLQYVPVNAATNYHFHAYIRTEAITTESGIRFHVLDFLHPNDLSLSTDNLTGTHPWTAADIDLTTGPQTTFLAIGVQRTPSRLFDNKLGGTAWIADVSLVPTQTAARPDAGRKSR